MTTVTDEMVERAAEVIYQKLAVSIHHARDIAKAALNASLPCEPRAVMTSSKVCASKLRAVHGVRISERTENDTTLGDTPLRTMPPKHSTVNLRGSTMLADFDATKWQLVPKEPTDEMRALFVNVHGENDFYDAYAAMLAAAPSPDQQPKEVMPAGTELQTRRENDTPPQPNDSANAAAGALDKRVQQQRDCNHPDLYFASGGFYVFCHSCGATWVALRYDRITDAGIDYHRSNNVVGNFDHRLAAQQPDIRAQVIEECAKAVEQCCVNIGTGSSIVAAKAIRALATKST